MSLTRREFLLRSAVMALALIQKVERLKKLKEERKERRRQLQSRQFTRNSSDGGILDLIQQLSPSYHRPEHFAGYAKRLEVAVGAGLRLVFAAPPQHGKSETTVHGLVWIVRNHAGKRHAYITYNQSRARRMAKKVRRLLAEAGVVTTGTLDNIELPNGGQILFTSIDGGITGEPVDGVAVIDDPFKNRGEADSARRREVVVDSYREAIETRVHPGASIIVLATRWHPEDLSGVLIAEGWEEINLPAIANDNNDPNGRALGEPLFPKMWPLEELEKKRAKVLDFTWDALYQGRPRPKGGKVFKEAHYYSRLPTKFRGSYGVDLAFSAKTQSDWSICLELWVDAVETKNGEPIFYIKHVDRAQVEAPSFTLTLKARHAARKAWRMLWRASGTEQGSAQFIRKQGIPLQVQQPPGDKLVSATDVAAAWNDGRVLMPDPEEFPEAWDEWGHAFMSVIQNFTGSGKEKDDDVDALGNAHKALTMAAGGESDRAMIIRRTD